MLRATLIHALDLVGLGEPARQAKKFVEARLRAFGISDWMPLVPEQEFEDCLRGALRALRDAAGADPQGGPTSNSASAAAPPPPAPSGRCGPRGCTGCR